MRSIQIILSVISLLLVIFTLICGFWIHNSKNVIDMESSVNFHMMIAVAACVSVLAATIITLVRR